MSTEGKREDQPSPVEAPQYVVLGGGVRVSVGTEVYIKPHGPCPENKGMVVSILGRDYNTKCNRCRRRVVIDISPTVEKLKAVSLK